MSSFDVFRSSIKGDLVSPSDKEYPQAIKRWALSSERPAKFVVFVKDANDVAQTIKYAVAQKLPIAICSAGKHSLTGASSSDGGIGSTFRDILVVSGSTPRRSLRVLKEVRFGKRWIRLRLSMGWQRSLRFLVGSLLGGCYGWLSPQYGLAIDNLIQATVVTASGAILTASASSNPDLFWGIRGGGSNFGVCTEFMLKLYPQRDTAFAGMVVIPSQLIGAAFEAQEAWWNNGPSEKEASIVVFDMIEDKPAAMFMLFYNGSEEEGKAAFKHVFDLGPEVYMTSEMPYEKVNLLLNERAPPGQNIYLRSVFLSTPSPSAPSIAATLASTYASFVSTASAGVYDAVAKFTLIHEFYPSSAVSRVANDATAFAHREPKLTVFAFGYWETETEGGEKGAREGVGKMLDVVAGVESRIEVGNNLGYGDLDGDASFGGFERSKIAFGENYERLREVKKMYDPGMVFDRWYPIEPAT